MLNLFSIADPSPQFLYQFLAAIFFLCTIALTIRNFWPQRREIVAAPDGHSKPRIDVQIIPNEFVKKLDDLAAAIEFNRQEGEESRRKLYNHVDVQTRRIVEQNDVETRRIYDLVGKLDEKISNSREHIGEINGQLKQMNVNLLNLNETMQALKK